jgi:hypothetical protein
MAFLSKSQNFKASIGDGTYRRSPLLHFPDLISPTIQNLSSPQACALPEDMKIKNIIALNAYFILVPLCA